MTEHEELEDKFEDALDNHTDIVRRNARNVGVVIGLVIGVILTLSVMIIGGMGQ